MYIAGAASVAVTSAPSATNPYAGVDVVAATGAASTVPYNPERMVPKTSFCESRNGLKKDLAHGQFGIEWMGSSAADLEWSGRGSSGAGGRWAALNLGDELSAR
jgi:hypothetical protein